MQAGLICCAVLLLTVPPEARIQCRGNFQMTKYGPIATPYCEEEQIAFVARSYGQSVSQVRKNPLMKVYLCQTLGYDSRLNPALDTVPTRTPRPVSSIRARSAVRQALP